MLEMKEWDGFEGRLWKEEINVRQFIQDNYTPYDGNEDFLAGPTEATDKLWGALQKLQNKSLPDNLTYICSDVYFPHPPANHRRQSLIY